MEIRQCIDVYYIFRVFVSFYEKISCMYRVLVEKVVYVSSIKKNENSKKIQILVQVIRIKTNFNKVFTRFSAFIRFLLFVKRNPHKLNILSTEAEEIGQARISRNRIIFR